MIAGGKEPLLAFVVDRLEVGIFAVDAEMRVVLWNRFMSMYSGKPADEVMGRDLFESFPELPRTWLEKKSAMYSCSRITHSHRGNNARICSGFTTTARSPAASTRCARTASCCRKRTPPAR